MQIAILAFTPGGAETLGKITAALDCDFVCYDKKQHDLKPWIAEQFATADAIIFVGAAGIAVRLIAKLIAAKDKDPAVIVVDEQCGFVIPILSGHIGGANALAKCIGEKLMAVPVITTATDINHKFAVDTWATEHGAVVGNIANIKHISAAILRDEAVGFISSFPVDAPLPDGITAGTSAPIGIAVTLDENTAPFATTLHIIPKTITLGIGCKKGIDPIALEQFVLDMLEEQHISIKAVAGIASIDLKKEEPCILALAEKYGWDFTVFTGEALANLEGEFTPSAFVKQTTGVDNVCERSAILKSGGTLLQKKTSRKGMTIAIAKANWRCRF